MATLTSPAYSTKTRIFPNAGRLTLIKHNADGTDTTNLSEIYTSDRSIIDSITTKYSTTSEDMNDGNAFDPAATHITGRAVEVAVVMNTYDPILYAFVTSAETETVDNGYIFKAGEEFTIPSASPYTVELPVSAINASGVCIVRKPDGTDYAAVTEGTPTTGQYSVDAATATFTFSAADKGKPVIISAEWACSKLTKTSVASQPKQNVYTLIADGKNCDKDENDELADNFKVDSVKIKGDIQPPARQKAYSKCTYTFALVKPRTGAKSFEMLTGKISERT